MRERLVACARSLFGCGVGGHFAFAQMKVEAAPFGMPPAAENAIRALAASFRIDSFTDGAPYTAGSRCFTKPMIRSPNERIKPSAAGM